MIPMHMAPHAYPFVVWNSERSTARALVSCFVSRAFDQSHTALHPTRTPKKKNAWNPMSLRYAITLFSGVADAGRHAPQITTTAAAMMQTSPETPMIFAHLFIVSLSFSSGSSHETNLLSMRDIITKKVTRIMNI